MLLAHADALYVKPNVVTMNATLSALEKGAQWQRAAAVLDAMAERGLAPDVYSVSATISACGKGLPRKVL